MVAKYSFILVGYLFIAGQDVAGLFADDIIYSAPMCASIA
jgi:hypothetical protein